MAGLTKVRLKGNDVAILKKSVFFVDRNRVFLKESEYFFALGIRLLLYSEIAEVRL